MKRTYQRPSIQVLRIDNEQIMQNFTNYHVNLNEDKYDGPVIEKLDPSPDGATAKWDEKI